MNTAATRLRKANFRKGMNYTFVTAFAAACLAIFLVPFVYMIFTSLKTHTQMVATGCAVIPGRYPELCFQGSKSPGPILSRLPEAVYTGPITINMKDYVGQDTGHLHRPAARWYEEEYGGCGRVPAASHHHGPGKPIGCTDPLERRLL